MSKQTEYDSRHYLFLLKVSACFVGLLLGSFVIVPKASMQDEPEPATSNTVIVSNNMRMMGNYRPTPEPPKSTVRGRVFYEDTGRAVRRASIMLMAKDSGGGSGREVSGLTDNNGYFQIKNVNAGTYYAFINAPGVVSPLAFADMTKPKDDNLEEAVAGFPPIIVSGIGDLDVQIPARRGGAISGRVMYADGDAVIGVKVEILRKAEKRYISVVPNFSSIFSMMMGGGGGFQTDDRGFYRFAGLPAGDYIVKVTENVSHSENKSRGYNSFEDSLFGGNSLLTMFYPDVFTTEKAQMVSVVAGQEQSEINITIPDRELYAVAGKVVSGKDKSLIKNASVSIKRIGDNTVSIFSEINKRQQTSLSDEQGNWNFKELPKGTYSLVIEPPNENLYYEGDIHIGNQNRNPNAPPKPKLAKKIQEITVEDKNLSEIVIELGYGAIVSGTVVTENSQEMPSSVSISANNGENEDMITSAMVYNGSGNDMERENPQPKKINHDFKLEGVPEGKTEFYISVSDDNFYIKSAMFNGTDLLAAPIVLKDGETLRNVQVVLSKGVGTLKGKITDGEKSPAKKVSFLLVPTNAVKRKNRSFYRSGASDENGEFEIKIAPNEYAIVFYGKGDTAKRGDELDRWIDEAVKDAVKVTVKANETEKIALTEPK